MRGGNWRTNKHGEGEYRCPDCGEWMQAHHVDIGIGMQQVSPFCCENCGFVEPNPYEEPDEKAAA